MRSSRRDKNGLFNDTKRKRKRKKKRNRKR